MYRKKVGTAVSRSAAGGNKGRGSGTGIGGGGGSGQQIGDNNYVNAVFSSDWNRQVLTKLRNDFNTASEKGMQDSCAAVPAGDLQKGKQEEVEPQAKGLHILTKHNYLSGRLCMKRFALSNILPFNDQPKLSIGDAIRIEDGQQVYTLYRRHQEILSQNWRTGEPCLALRFVGNRDFYPAVLDTQRILREYFACGSQAPLVIFDGAFIAKQTLPNGSEVELRTRVDCLKYTPGNRTWQLIEVKAYTEVVGDKQSPARSKSLVYDFGFQTHVVQNALTDMSTLPGRVTTLNPVRIKIHSSVLAHPWNAFPGPISCVDLDARRAGMYFRYTPLKAVFLKAFPDDSEDINSDTALDEKIAELVNADIQRLCHTLCADEASLKRTYGHNFGNFDSLQKYATDMYGRPIVDQGAQENGGPTPPLPPPTLVLSPQCNLPHPCPYLSEGMCLPPRASDSVFSVPVLNVSRKVELWNAGTRTVGKLEDTSSLSAAQARYVRAAKKNVVLVNPNAIRSWFSQIRYPLFCLDFEAAQFACPPFAKVKPYGPVGFQYALDVIQQDVLDFSEEPTHYEYIHFGPEHKTSLDPRPRMLNELMKAIETEREKANARINDEVIAEVVPSLKSDKVMRKSRITDYRPADDGKGKQQVTSLYKKAIPQRVHTDGTLVAHMVSFEKRIIKDCLTSMTRVREDAKMMNDSVEKLLYMDSIPLLRKGLCHPQFKGSYSLKSVLPVLCPEISYGTFADGSAAQGDNAAAIFREWYREGSIPLLESDPPELHARREKLNKRFAELRESLLSYCNLDTSGMLKVIRKVSQFCAIAELEGVPIDEEQSVLADPATFKGWVEVPLDALERHADIRLVKEETPDPLLVNKDADLHKNKAKVKRTKKERKVGTEEKKQRKWRKAAGEDEEAATMVQPVKVKKAPRQPKTSGAVKKRSTKPKK